MVSRQNHVRHLPGDAVDPLLPKIPIRLVQHAHVAAPRTPLVGNLARRKGSLIVGRNAAGELAAGAVVAHWPVACAGKDAAKPVVCVGDVAAVPGKRDSLVEGPVEFPESAAGVGVPHVVEDGDSKGPFASGLAGSLEAQNLGSSGAVGGRDLVIVGCIGAEVADLDVMIELAALGDGDPRARRSAVIPIRVRRAQEESRHAGFLAWFDARERNLRAARPSSNAGQ